MAKDNAAATPATLKIELLHPVSHDGVVFSRGVHTLARETALAFLKLRDETRKHFIAREFVSPQAPEGKTTLAPDSAELTKSKQAPEGKTTLAPGNAELTKSKQ